MKAGAINKKILVLIVVVIFACAGVVVIYLKGRAPSTIKNLGALYLTSSDATLKAEYKFDNRWSDAKIRFEYKMENSSDNWNYTDWREASENARSRYESRGNKQKSIGAHRSSYLCLRGSCCDLSKG